MLDEHIVKLIKDKNFAFLATRMKDGAPIAKIFILIIDEKDTNSFQGIMNLNYGNESQYPSYSYYVATIP